MANTGQQAAFLPRSREIQSTEISSNGYTRKVLSGSKEENEEAEQRDLTFQVELGETGPVFSIHELLSIPITSIISLYIRKVLDSIFLLWDDCPHLQVHNLVLVFELISSTGFLSRTGKACQQDAALKIHMAVWP